jgi:hypothetical protein
MGAVAGRAAQAFDGDAHVLTLGRLVDVLVGNPAPAVAGDLVALLDDRRCHLRICVSSAMATPNTVSGSLRRSNSRRMRQTPDTRAVLVDPTPCSCGAPETPPRR